MRQLSACLPWIPYKISDLDGGIDPNIAASET